MGKKKKSKTISDLFLDRPTSHGGWPDGHSGGYTDNKTPVNQQLAKFFQDMGLIDDDNPRARISEGIKVILSESHLKRYLLLKEQLEGNFIGIVEYEFVERTQTLLDLLRDIGYGPSSNKKTMPTRKIDKAGAGEHGKREIIPAFNLTSQSIVSPLSGQDPDPNPAKKSSDTLREIYESGDPAKAGELTVGNIICNLERYTHGFQMLNVSFQQDNILGLGQNSFPGVDIWNPYAEEDLDFRDVSMDNGEIDFSSKGEFSSVKTSSFSSSGEEKKQDVKLDSVGLKLASLSIIGHWLKNQGDFDDNRGLTSRRRFGPDDDTEDIRKATAMGSSIYDRNTGEGVIKAELLKRGINKVKIKFGAYNLGGISIHRITDFLTSLTDEFTTNYVARLTKKEPIVYTLDVNSLSSLEDLTRSSRVPEETEETANDEFQDFSSQVYPTSVAFLVGDEIEFYDDYSEKGMKNSSSYNQLKGRVFQGSEPASIVTTDGDGNVAYSKTIKAYKITEEEKSKLISYSLAKSDQGDSELYETSAYIAGLIKDAKDINAKLKSSLLKDRKNNILAALKSKYDPDLIDKFVRGQPAYLAAISLLLNLSGANVRAQAGRIINTRQDVNRGVESTNEEAISEIEQSLNGMPSLTSDTPIQYSINGLIGQIKQDFKDKNYKQILPKIENISEEIAGRSNRNKPEDQNNFYLFTEIEDKITEIFGEIERITSFEEEIEGLTAAEKELLNKNAGENTYLFAFLTTLKQSLADDIFKEEFKLAVICFYFMKPKPPGLTGLQIQLLLKEEKGLDFNYLIGQAYSVIIDRLNLISLIIHGEDKVNLEQDAFGNEASNYQNLNTQDTELMTQMESKIYKKVVHRILLESFYRKRGLR